MTQLTSEQLAIRDMTRSFVRREVAPFAAEWDRAAAVNPATVRKAGELGLFGVAIPGEWGGAGADMISYVLAMEELAYGDAGFCNLVTATNSFALKVLAAGTPDQKRRFLAPVARGEQVACMLLTEPQAGSDAANLATRAVQRGDRYVLNGTKSFVTSGRSSGSAIVLAVTDPALGKRGISAFLVRTSEPGYRVLREERKLGHRSNEACQVLLEDLEVPAEDMLGQPARASMSPSQASRSAASSWPRSRSGWRGLHSMQPSRMRNSARRSAGRSASTRRSPSSLPTWPLRSRWPRACACTPPASGRRRRPASRKPPLRSCSPRKMCERVCSAAIQIHGGYGFTNDFPVERYYRDARVFQIYDGTNEVQKIVIARELMAGR